MAQAPGERLTSLARGFNQLSNAQKVGLLAGIAAVIALATVALLWVRTPEYRVLYSNLADKDGGEVLASLTTLNIPYRMADGGTAILVPAGMVYDTRLRLATQGLPKGSAVGFELMEAQKFGISQFAEQVNYQRALAGELSRTIQALASVQSARVHLAIPRPTVFVREQLKPSASVLVTLYAGRSLDEAQVTAIQHLVASSVPELMARSVTVVDQVGNLLTGTSEGVQQAGGLDASQLKYVHAIEAAFVTRIENILQPIVGRENVRAQVAANLDFSWSEQTSETFRPNPGAQEQSLRSQQTVETTSSTPVAPSGVPGALSNQPPGAANAPLTSPSAAPTTSTSKTPTPASTNSHRENTVNYELDKTIRHTKNELGAIKRLSVAVVVNQRRTNDKDGKIVFVPRTEAELSQINELVREAMGFSKDRGDTLNVVSTSFDAPQAEAVTGSQFRWQDWITPANLVEAGKYLLGAIVVLYLWFGFLRPTLRDLMQAGLREEPTLSGMEGIGIPPGGAISPAPVRPQGPGYDADLQAVQDIARTDPRIVANVVRDWVAGNE
ncbi:MAG: flagellar basal-body MS-ring/collar protein FliF [Betaproteobacteria bacterium]